MYLSVLMGCCFDAIPLNIRRTQWNSEILFFTESVGFVYMRREMGEFREFHLFGCSMCVCIVVVSIIFSTFIWIHETLKFCYIFVSIQDDFQMSKQHFEQCIRKILVWRVKGKKLYMYTKESTCLKGWKKIANNRSNKKSSSKGSLCSINPSHFANRVLFHNWTNSMHSVQFHAMLSFFSTMDFFFHIFNSV